MGILTSFGTRLTPVLAVVALGGTLGLLARNANACSVPPTAFLPSEEANNVPTNTRLISTAGAGEWRFWLKKLVPPQPASSPNDAGVEPNLDAGTSVPLDVTCFYRGYTEVCMASPDLEPRTYYAWNSVSNSPPRVFLTGDGPRVPAALPKMNVERGATRSSKGDGGCATEKGTQLTVRFEASADAWLLVSGNPKDTPIAVTADQTKVSWESVDAQRCFGLEQINFLGEVFATTHEVCILEPVPDAGLDTIADAGEHQEPTTIPAEGWLPGNDLIQDGNDIPRAQSAKHRGCNVYATANPPYAAWPAAWFLVLLGACAFRRRRVLTARSVVSTSR